MEIDHDDQPCGTSLLHKDGRMSSKQAASNFAIGLQPQALLVALGIVFGIGLRPKICNVVATVFRHVNEPLVAEFDDIN
ncbi:hypothetical protein [Rhizobium sp. Root482]|uniref:hypothetical protein n=1 Tax=Rhizobium sp. Root482 TaxID=1736543 RepID=UPI0006F4A53C|nr:hypothetical protein [Rhizobium sp. Root482]KQY11330.1 hypothetical protein ASD31_18280 [Rhizobium sp. Root482]